MVESWGEQCIEVKRPIISLLDIKAENLDIFDEKWMDQVTPESVCLK